MTTYTVPWLPQLQPGAEEIPGELVAVMQAVARVANERPGCDGCTFIDVMHATNPCGFTWEECETAVEMAIELGMVDVVLSAYAGSA